MDAIEKTSLGIELEPARQVFLAELAFSDLNCSALVASRLAQDTFDAIETNTWITLRRQLLDCALEGLHSDLLRNDTEKRIRFWYPSRHKFLRGVFQAMSKWPKDTETLETLIRGLQDELEWGQRAAAEALADNFRGDSSVKERLFKLLLTPAEPNLTVNVLHALCLGWPDEPKLSSILDQARQASDIALRILAIYHRVTWSQHDAKDRDILLEFMKDNPFAGFHWRDDAVNALVRGWPNDTEIKALALKSLNSRWSKEGPIDHDFVGPLLIKGFPNDAEVAQEFANVFTHEEFPQNRIGLHGDWTPLIESFAGHPQLGQAIDNWLERNPENHWEGKLALASKSSRAKQFLLRPDSTTGVINQYQARWLMDGWGMDDFETAEALLKLSNSSRASSIANLLPRIMPDKNACRSRLLDWLQNEENQIAQLALIGLINLGCDEQDKEVADAAVEKFSGQVPCGVQWLGIADVIRNFPHHPKTRELAIYQIKNRGGMIDTVAHIYKDDSDMRQEVLKHLSPLPENLRIRIVDRISSFSQDNDFAHQLLSEYDEDIGLEVKTSAAIAYSRLIQARGSDEAPLLEAFSKGIRAVGPDMDERIHAAFAGLIELNRLDVIPQDPESTLRFRLSSPHKWNSRMAIHIANNWMRLRSTFGEGFLKMFSFIPDGFLEEMISHTNNKEFGDEIVSIMQNNTGASLSIAALRIRSLQWHRSERLRRLCVDRVGCFHISSWNETAPGILAAEILAEQFSQDDSTRNEIEILKDSVRTFDPLIIALCIAWPNSPVLKELADSQHRLLLPARLHILCRFAKPDELIHKLDEIFPKLRGDIWEFLPTSTRAIQLRFERDASIRKAAYQRLDEGATPSEKVNFPQLLRRTETSIDKLRTWCQKELQIQNSLEDFPEFALDIYSGSTRPVGHILLEILTG
ncbi:MAG: hypothetical protein O2999_02380 [Nitrospirae bacterium]|nr:hypothetical protein [Nitrospirota bacterium]MDA1303143.1 hypothetical protein [Nitrospirota bacterium]